MKSKRRLLPITGISIAIFVSLLLLYNRVLEQGEIKCFQELSATAELVRDEIQTKFQDEIVKMHLIETILLQNAELKEDFLHTDMVKSNTIFSRIDMLYADGTLVSEGTKSKVQLKFDMEEILSMEEHLTTRRQDAKTGNECVYYLLPIVKEGEAVGVLIGVVELQRLSDIFQTVIYEGQANICIIDVKDGSYIMDSWHENLGNAYETEERKKLEGYEDVKLQESLKNMETGSVAFVSNTTGKGLYMYYTPIEMFDWQLSIFAQEDVVFGYLQVLRSEFIFVGSIIMALNILYFAWNIQMIRLLEKSNWEVEKQKEELKQISYHDMLTTMYNRNKYMEDWKQLREQTPEKIGIAYIDLNGLKQINDSQMHEAGDAYIKNTAKVILSIFEPDCYRIGGDEFIILKAGIEMEEFEQRIETLKEDMIKEGISVSLGISWAENSKDLNGLLKLAETRMYENKELYYMTHEKKR